MEHLNRWGVTSHLALFAGIVVLGAPLAGCTAAGAEDDRPTADEAPIAAAAEAADGDVMPTLAVDRVWAEPGMGYGYAAVTMTNDTAMSFDSAVRVRCDAVDAEGAEIGSHRAAFFASEHGRMAPGFTGTLKVSVPLKRRGLDDMNCVVEWAR